MPVKKKKPRRKNRGAPRVQKLAQRLEQFEEEDGVADQLGHDDIKSLFGEITIASKMKATFLKTLCHFKKCCGKSREVKARQFIAARFEK